MAPIALLRQLRARNGASLRDCQAALRETGGDVDRAIAWLDELALTRIMAVVRCSRDHARAGFARFGWDHERACDEAHRLMPEPDPVSAARMRRAWQVRAFARASCARDLYFLVARTDLGGTTLGHHISELVLVEDLIEDDDLIHYYWTDRWQVRAGIDAFLDAVGATELRALLNRPFDIHAARRCIAALYLQLREQLATALVLDPHATESP